MPHDTSSSNRLLVEHVTHAPNVSDHRRLLRIALDEAALAHHRRELADRQRLTVAQLRELRDSIEKEFDVKLPHLSMGMTHDFWIAVEEGATLVRVGTAIFGERPKRAKN